VSEKAFTPVRIDSRRGNLLSVLPSQLVEIYHPVIPDGGVHVKFPLPSELACNLSFGGSVPAGVRLTGVDWALWCPSAAKVLKCRGVRPPWCHAEESVIVSVARIDVHPQSGLPRREVENMEGIIVSRDVADPHPGDIRGIRR